MEETIITDWCIHQLMKLLSTFLVTDDIFVFPNGTKFPRNFQKPTHLRLSRILRRRSRRSSIKVGCSVDGGASVLFYVVCVRWRRSRPSSIKVGCSMGWGVSALFVCFVTCLVAPVASIEHQSRMFDGGGATKVCRASSRTSEAKMPAQGSGRGGLSIKQIANVWRGKWENVT